MARDWHEQFKRWAKPPSNTEEEKGARAASMIRNAIRASQRLKDRHIDIYATGSYANNTNIRLGSDIDVALVLRDMQFSSLPGGVSWADVGLVSVTDYSYSDFRDDVEAALRATFGADVRPRNKTFEIRENTYHLNADATAFLLHRSYTGRGDNGAWLFDEGAELRPRDAPGTRIINWHKQHYKNGVAKNARTDRRYKRLARILKNLSVQMASEGTLAARAAAQVPSFLIECLVYNTPDSKFNLVEGSYYKDVRSVLAWLWNQTRPGVKTGEDFEEVSGLKWLFRSQEWTMAQAHAFLLEAWKHVGFEN